MCAGGRLTSVQPDRPVVVGSKRLVADGMVELVLEPVDDRPLPRWAPGAHVDLVLPSGSTRPYSLAGVPGDDGWRLLVSRSGRVGGSSSDVHDVVEVGDHLRVRGPRDLFQLRGATRYLFLSAGAGVAPLLPMARWVRAARIYPWGFVHLDRSTQHEDLRHEVVDLGPTARSVRRRSEVFDVLASQPAGTAVYACGAGAFVDAVASAASAGVQVHRQRFDAPSPNPGTAQPYDAVLARRGDRVRVDVGTPLLTALHQAGVPVAVSCGAGICGACTVPVLEGGLLHRDSVLTDVQRAGGRLVVSCVSGGTGPSLVLDL